MASLHQDLIVIDGLIVSNWSRAVFEDMHRGGITAANCTCSVWEGFRATMENLARWHQWFREFDDILLPVHTIADIEVAKQTGKVGIVLGWQNLTGIEDRIEFLGLFKALGVGIVQLAYNTQNLVGSGCYETRDGGLSDFGRDVIDEMNRVGMLVDLSHVGSRTSDDAIRHSTKPVCYSHTCPRTLRDHPRNKTDAEMRFIAEKGGFVGVTMFPPFLPKGADSTLDDYLDAIAHTIDVAGEDHVGIGTDMTQDQGPDFIDWITRDKGLGRRLTEFGEIKNPPGFQRLGEFPNLTAAMEARGWPEPRIRKVMGENWKRLLADVWGG
ncbi:MAG: dipeptidase [Alphaproteobacteria bacterium]|jgi:membrane dipeptidase|nr:dipeptidase [Alphaproteobacteria bacterium]MDP6516490.1 dipeptidase [Alphaproteobacteria bacterium]